MLELHHRRWHAVNGRMLARMWLRERTGYDGSLGREPSIRAPRPAPATPLPRATPGRRSWYRTARRT